MENLSNSSNLQNIMGDVFEDLEKKYIEKKLSFFPSGLSDLDHMANMMKGDFVVVAGRPGMGKTSYLLNLLNSLATNQNKGALISLGLSQKKMVYKYLSLKSKVNSRKIYSGLLAEDEWGRIGIASGKMSMQPLSIHADQGNKLDDIIKRIREIHDKSQLDFVIIDDIYKINVEGTDRNDEISKISIALKALAIELDVLMVVSAPVSKYVEQRANRRPILGDLPYGTQLESDADIIKFLYRDDYYNSDSEFKGIAEILLAKNSNGPISFVKTWFIPETSLFTEYTKHID